MRSSTPIEKTVALGQDTLKKVFTKPHRPDEKILFTYIDENSEHLKIDLSPLHISANAYLSDLHRLNRFTLITHENKTKTYSSDTWSQLNEDLAQEGFSPEEVQAIQMSFFHQTFSRRINVMVIDRVNHAFINSIEPKLRDYTLHANRTYTYHHNNALSINTNPLTLLDLGPILYHGKIEKDHACCTEVRVSPILKLFLDHAEISYTHIDDARQPVNALLNALQADFRQTFISRCNNDPDFFAFLEREFDKSPQKQIQYAAFKPKMALFFTKLLALDDLTQNNFLALIGTPEQELYLNIKIAAFGTLTVLAVSFAALVILAGFSASIIGPAVALAVVIVGCFFYALHQKKQADQRVNSAILLLNSKTAVIPDQTSSSVDPMQP